MTDDETAENHLGGYQVSAKVAGYELRLLQNDGEWQVWIDFDDAGVVLGFGATRQLAMSMAMRSLGAMSSALLRMDRSKGKFVEWSG